MVQAGALEQGRDLQQDIRAGFQKQREHLHKEKGHQGEADGQECDYGEISSRNGQFRQQPGAPGGKCREETAAAKA